MKWKFREYLDGQGVTPYRLTQHLHGKISPSLIYKWARETEPKMLHFRTLDLVADGLKELTGKKVEPTDLFEFSNE